jgi:hypothetical protein
MQRVAYDICWKVSWTIQRRIINKSLRQFSYLDNCSLQL